MRRDSLGIRMCVCVCLCNSSSFLPHIVVYKKITGENVTKDNNSIVHNDELFHTIEERYILGEEGNKSPGCNGKIVHVTRPM